MAGDFGDEALVPSIPNVSSAAPEAVLQAIKQWIDVRQGATGDGLDRAVTLRDLLNAGVVSASAVPVIVGSGSPIVLPPGTAEPAVPPTPTNLTVAGAVTTIVLNWDFARGYSRLSNFELWRSATDVLGDAVEIAHPAAAPYTDEVGTDAQFYYWVRAVSDGGTSPFSSLTGVLGVTSMNVQLAIEAINAGVTPTSPFFVQTVPTTINGVAVPVGCYMTAAYIMNGVITSAKIGLLQVDDARISSVAVSKITAGQLSVGAYVESSNYLGGQSGFHINANGNVEFNNATLRGTIYAPAGNIGGNLIDASGVQSPNYNGSTAGWRVNSDGSAVFNSATIRGTVYATAGQIGGNTIDSTGVQSPGYNGSTVGWRINSDGSVFFATGTFRGSVAVGAFTGYGWPAAGNYGAFLGAAGLLMGNANNNRYIQITNTGDIYTPAWSIVAGVMTLNQANVVNTLNIAGNAVTVPVSLMASTSNYSSVNITLGAGAYVTIVARSYASPSSVGANSIRVILAGNDLGTISASDNSDVVGIFMGYAPAGTSTIGAYFGAGGGTPSLQLVATACVR